MLNLFKFAYRSHNFLEIQRNSIMDLKEIVSRIDALKAEIDSMPPLTAEQESRLMQKLRLDWNFHSNHIEGNSLTYSETKSFLLWHITAEGKPFKDYLEMKGHNEAVEYLLDVLRGKDIQLTEHLIRELHKIILSDEYEADAITTDGKPIKRKITPGQYKTAPNHVKTKSGEIFHFATPEDTPAQMTDLMKWYNQEIAENKTHPLIIASLFHYNFVKIHPFDDGNGRISRLLMNLILMKFGFIPVIIPFDTKEDYYNALQYADADDIDKFTIFIGERLLESLNLVWKAKRNEPLEEIADIDKMVQDLEMKLKASVVEEDVKIEKSREVIKGLYNSFIANLSVHLIKKILKVKQFFELINIVHFINGTGTNINDEDYSIYFEKPSFLDNDINELVISIDLRRLKNYDIPFLVQSEIRLKFLQYYYEIDYIANKKINVKRRYHQILTEEEINEIVMDLFKFAYSKIDEKIKESNAGNS